MPKHLMVWAAIVLVVLAGFVWLMPRGASASGFDAPAIAVEITDADICFGPGNQGVGYACNSVCFGLFDPEQYSTPIPCPGPAAAMRFESAPNTVSCGSQSTLSVVVSDAKGLAVANDTVVNFTTDGGVVGASSATHGGLAQASFMVWPKTSGVAHIVATVGSVRAEKRIDVGC